MFSGISEGFSFNFDKTLSENPFSSNPFGSSPFGTTSGLTSGTAIQSGFGDPMYSSDSKKESSSKETNSEEQPVIEIQTKNPLLSAKELNEIADGLKDTILKPMRSLIDEYKDDIKKRDKEIRELTEMNTQLTEENDILEIRLWAMRLFLMSQGAGYEYKEFLEKEIYKTMNKKAADMLRQGLKDVELLFKSLKEF